MSQPVMYQKEGVRGYKFNRSGTIGKRRRMTNHEEQALDVVQEAHLSAMTHLDELRNPDAFIG